MKVGRWAFACICLLKIGLSHVLELKYLYFDSGLPEFTYLSSSTPDGEIAQLSVLLCLFLLQKGAEEGPGSSCHPGNLVRTALFCQLTCKAPAICQMVNSVAASSII